MEEVGGVYTWVAVRGVMWVEGVGTGSEEGGTVLGVIITFPDRTG